MVKKGEDPMIHPMDIMDKRCYVEAAISFEGIFVSSSHVSLQVKVTEVAMTPVESQRKPDVCITEVSDDEDGIAVLKPNLNQVKFSLPFRLRENFFNKVMALFFCYANKRFGVSGDLDIKNYKITNLPNPTTNSEPVTKSYADTHYSSGLGSGAQDQKVTKVTVVHEDRIGKVIKVTVVHEDLKVTLAHKDLKVILVTKDPRVTKAILAHRDPRVTKATLVLVDLKVIHEALEQKVIKATVVHEDVKDIKVIKGSRSTRC